MSRTTSFTSLLPLIALGGLAFAAEVPRSLTAISVNPQPPSLPAPAAAPAAPRVVMEADSPAADVLQIRARTIYLGDGSRIEDGVVAIEGGRIRAVGRGVGIDPDAATLVHDGVLTAGMVVSHSWFGTRGENHDAARTILPGARVAHAFNPGHSDFRKAREAGITSLVVAPTGQNLAGGMTCVVKTSGKMFRKEAHLALSFSKDALRQGVRPVFSFFDAQDQPRAVGDGLESSGGSGNGSRYPTSYPGTLAALDDLMADPKGAFASVATKEMPVLIEAWERNEIARAAGWARKHGLKGALRGAPLAGELAATLKQSGLGVILGPFGPGHPTRSLKGIVELSEQGVPLAFSLGSSGTDPFVARLGAAMAVGAGLDPVEAWKALSSDAARLAGVGRQVGRLERGMDADLVLWSGDPIDLTSKVQMVFIDGELVFGGDA